MAIPKPFLLFFLLFLVHLADAQNLSVSFYSSTCPSLELIVADTTAKFVLPDPTLAPALLRMHFHDCFVMGCDGSVLINSTSSNRAEKDSIPNLSLRGFHVIDAVKAEVEKKCPGKVSCADILALVARAAVALIKGPVWKVPLGRRDGNVSIDFQALINLPPPFASISQLIASFDSKGLNVTDLVVLSGSHTIGVSLCTSFASRIYNFSGTGDADPSMDPDYVTYLKKLCSPTDNTTTVEMDPDSSKDFDTSYFYHVKNRRGLFQSDEALLHNNETKGYIESHSSQNGFDKVFFGDFAASMEKMGRIGVLTGTDGEIRKDCSVVNY